ncbi:ATP-binding protein [Bifidobacterium sp. ESL0704]|uniref:ATP-binding protein n=1 Tax=Bifidobacterium sp. ESL0704 TaxID=2983219 RepID=UPI0023F693F7|nr:ATP-binding protein [Bifidobacterium sp. ESL0704]WEV53371.1 ATP-binding protein [Bifidobacterium sp. ESL0704]
MQNEPIQEDKTVGLFSSELLIGSITSVSPDTVICTVPNQQTGSGVQYCGDRQGVGEVGEYVVIQSQQVVLMGRISDVTVPHSDIAQLEHNTYTVNTVSANATIQLLGSIAQDTFKITAGVTAYPRLGDLVYSLPKAFLGLIPQNAASVDGDVQLELGTLKGTSTPIALRPEDLFSRHCAILGMTGGGKSYTLEHLLEELQRYSSSKAILIDSTGEYKPCCFEKNEAGEDKALDLISWLHTPNGDNDGNEIKFSASCFSDSDYFSLFLPTATTQAPTLLNALQSLRVLKALSADTSLSDQGSEFSTPESGILTKLGKKLSAFNSLINNNPSLRKIFVDPNASFDIQSLPQQVIAECIKVDNSGYWRENAQLLNWCQPLLFQIRQVLYSGHFPFALKTDDTDFTSKLDNFLKPKNKQQLLVVDISDMDPSGKARQVIVNAIANSLMDYARNKKIIRATRPLMLLIDEAHNFIGKSTGSPDFAYSLHGIEDISREGRKYGLNLVLATQRPRDLSGAVLSQMGTMIVHRLVNDSDQKIIRDTSGAASSASLRYLPDLQPGEALILGTDIPIPLDVQVAKPVRHPHSQSSNFQGTWHLIEQKQTDTEPQENKDETER